MKMKTRNHKKDKADILQRIRMRKTLKRKKCKNNFKKRKKQPVKPVSVPRTPRKFRRNQMKFAKNVNNVNLIDKSYKKSDCIKKYLPENLRYITETHNSPLNLKSIRKEHYNSKGIIIIPKNFSVIENSEESYTTLRQMISAFLLENSPVRFDYSKCQHIELNTQVLFDIILKDIVKFQKICKSVNRQKHNLFPILVGAYNINNPNVQKLLFSVGSPVELGIQENMFSDIEKYKLRIHSNLKEKNEQKRRNQKELDTSEMLDYVISCLKRMHKKLTPTKLDDLANVIGEILINAEEHSTTQCRFSIGYFKEESNLNNHFGLFRLVILNFGKTIYEKFKSDDCPNKNIVNRMNELSNSYTKRLLIFPGKFEEESLWTLYALQEGVTSISQDSYKRGNGSIRFIESFFNIKGSQDDDNISRMTIISGNTQIVFDGKYGIRNKTNERGEMFKVMTFNQTGNIEDKPDIDYVKYTKYYFPGTMICANILLNDDDIKQIK